MSCADNTDMARFFQYEPLYDVRFVPLRPRRHAEEQSPIAGGRGRRTHPRGFRPAHLPVSLRRAAWTRRSAGMRPGPLLQDASLRPARPRAATVRAGSAGGGRAAADHEMSDSHGDGRTDCFLELAVPVAGPPLCSAAESGDRRESANDIAAHQGARARAELCTAAFA